MEIKVKAIDGFDNKSKAQVEEKLLQDHEEQFESQEENSDGIQRIDLSSPVDLFRS